MPNIDDEWNSFMYNQEYSSSSEEDSDSPITTDVKNDFFHINHIPKSNDIYISTKTKIAHLSTPIDLDIFWKIHVMKYSTQKEGVIKKQIKLNSNTPEEVDDIKSRLKCENYCEEFILTHKESGKTPFKSVRRISIGLSKKDILTSRSKKKSAFYNCFVLIIRVISNDRFKEYHVKVFNTGKLEIPGVQEEHVFRRVLQLVIGELNKHLVQSITLLDLFETVLINSNFNCGYFINREILSDVLKYNYNIDTMYDPCSYPGIQCKYLHTNYDNTITKISFMVFRTGSVLIVGKCEEDILYTVYEFLKKLFINEYINIRQDDYLSIPPSTHNKSIKKKKPRFKSIFFSHQTEINFDILTLA